MERELQLFLFDRVFQSRRVFLWCEEKQSNAFHPSFQIWGAASGPINIVDV